MLFESQISPKQAQKLIALDSVTSEPLQTSVTLEDRFIGTFEEFCDTLTFQSAGETIPFKLFDYQRKIAYEVLSRRRDLISVVKSRQMGLTSLIAALIAFLCIRYGSYKVNIISISQYESSALGKHIRSILETFLTKHDFIDDNIRTMSLANGSVVRSFPNTSDVGRSFRADLTLLDECGFYPIAPILQSSAPGLLWSMLKNICDLYKINLHDPEPGKTVIEGFEVAEELMRDDTAPSGISLLVTTPSTKSSDYYQQFCGDGRFETARGAILSGESDTYQQWDIDDTGTALQIVCHITAIPTVQHFLQEIKRRMLPLLGGQIGWAKEFDLQFEDKSERSLGYDAVNNLFSSFNYNYPLRELERSGSDIVASLDPADSGRDDFAALVGCIMPKTCRILILREAYWSEREAYRNVEIWLESLKGETSFLSCVIEKNGLGSMVTNVLQSSKKVTGIRIKETVTSASSKASAIQFLTWLIDNNLITFDKTLVKLKSQLIAYDIAAGEGANNAKDDGVAALLHLLHTIDYDKWYKKFYNELNI